MKHVVITAVTLITFTSMMLSQRGMMVLDEGGAVVHEVLSSSSTTTTTSKIPLLDLIRTQEEDSCPGGLFFVNDTIDEASLQQELNDRKIPKIVHITSRTRCVTNPFRLAIDRWRFPGHSLLFHNEAAVDRLLLDKSWPEFPSLSLATHCFLSGAAKADLWRLLVLWEYGGIYTDFDNTPERFDGETLQPDDEGFFVVERSKIPSQYFMAFRPRHPFLYFAIHEVILRLLSHGDVNHQYVPIVTGPGPVRDALRSYLGKRHLPGADESMSDYQSFMKIAAGTYGAYNSTIRVEGNAGNPNEWVKRSVVPKKGKFHYKKMNMTHFDADKNNDLPIEACMQRLYSKYSTGML